MNKIIFIKFLIILFFVSSCGYTPTFSKKNSKFSIIEIETTGNRKLDKIINNKLKVYKNVKSTKSYSIVLDTNLKKEISSKDTKGNPKTFRMIITLKIYAKDKEDNLNEKIFSKSVNYNNNSSKSKLRREENKKAKNLTEKITEEVIIYLQSI